MSGNILEYIRSVTEIFEKYLQAFNLARLLATGEKDIANGKKKSAHQFFKDFKNEKKYQIEISEAAQI